MTSINKELYDALIAARVDEAVATNAARSVQGYEPMEGVEGRLDRVEERLDGVEERLDGVEERLDGIDKRLIIVETRLDSIVRLLWIIAAGVAGILVKSLLV